MEKIRFGGVCGVFGAFISLFHPTFCCASKAVFFGSLKTASIQWMPSWRTESCHLGERHDINTSSMLTFPHGRCTSPSSPTAVILSLSRMKSVSWEFLVPFSGWRCDPNSKLVGGLQIGDKKVTLTTISSWNPLMTPVLIGVWDFFWRVAGSKIEDVQQVPGYYKHPDITGCFIPFIYTLTTNQGLLVLIPLHVTS